MGVGNIETTVSNDKEVIDKTKNELLTVTAGRVSFWQGGSEVAYLVQKKLHFPSGTLEAFDAKLSGTVTAAAGSSFGPWSISESSIYRTDNTWGGAGLYFGIKVIISSKRLKAFFIFKISLMEALVPTLNRWK